MTLKISEVCLVANLQTMGPMYIGDTGKQIFDKNSGMMLAGRLIITSGMGNSASPVGKLHGPLPAPEIESTDYSIYYFICELQQQASPDSLFSTGKGTYIICVVVENLAEGQYHSYEHMIEQVLINYAPGIDFSETITGEITEEIERNVKEKLSIIYQEISESLKINPLFEGNSLFDVGLIADLPDHFAKIVKKFILNPKGLLASEVEENNVVKMLLRSGLVQKEQRDGILYLVPR